MKQPDALSRIKIDREELRTRRALFEITDEDLRRMADLRSFAEKYTDEIVEDFYALLMATR